MDTEFTSLMNLPSEMIVNICEEMDDSELGKFLSSSKQAKETCDSVMEKRNILYRRKIDEIFQQLISITGRTNELTLQSRPDRMFILILYIYANNFYLHERIIEKVSAAQKLGLNIVYPDVSFNTGNHTESEVKEIVYQLFKTGYLDLNVVTSGLAYT